MSYRAYVVGKLEDLRVCVVPSDRKTVQGFCRSLDLEWGVNTNESWWQYTENVSQESIRPVTIMDPDQGNYLLNLAALTYKSNALLHDKQGLATNCCTSHLNLPINSRFSYTGVWRLCWELFFKEVLKWHS